jgi:hypothetical protein
MDRVWADIYTRSHTGNEYKIQFSLVLLIADYTTKAEKHFQYLRISFPRKKLYEQKIIASYCKQW